MWTEWQTLRTVEGRRKDVFKKKAIERKEHTGISTGCIQPQAAVKESNTGECECVCVRERERERVGGGAILLEGT